MYELNPSGESRFERIPTQDQLADARDALSAIGQNFDSDDVYDLASHGVVDMPSSDGYIMIGEGASPDYDLDN